MSAVEAPRPPAETPETPPPNTWEVIQRRIREVGPAGLVGHALEVDNKGPEKTTYVNPDDVPGSKLYVIGEAQSEEVTKDLLVPGGFRPVFMRGGIYHIMGQKPRYAAKTVLEPRYVLYKLKPTHVEEDGTIVYGELQDIQRYSEDDLKKFVEKHDATFADPREKRAEIPRHEYTTDPSHPRDLIKFDINDRADVFGNLTAQLEANGIQNWSGLEYTKVWRESDPDNPGSRIIRRRIVKVVRDTAVKAIDRDRRDFEMSRKIVTAEYEQRDGQYVRVEGKVQTIDEHFADALRKFRKGGGWFENVTAPKPSGEVPGGARDLNHRIHDDWGLLQDIEHHDRVAAWMLGYVDVSPGGDEDTKAAKKAQLERLVKSKEGKRRIDVLRDMLNEHGSSKVYALAQTLRDDFMESAAELDLETDISDTTGKIKTVGASISWVIENMIDHYTFSRHPGAALRPQHRGMLYTDLFRNTLAARLAQRDIVDRRIGSSLMDAVMHWEEKPTVEGVDPKTKQPVYKIKRELLFDSAPLNKVPPITRDEVKELEQHIYRNSQAHKPVRLVELIHLGRLLRRGVGR